MKNFKLTYSWYDKSDKLVVDKKQIIVKKNITEIGAKIKLERYLASKHEDFGRLVVWSCEEYPLFMDIFQKFSK